MRRDLQRGLHQEAAARIGKRAGYDLIDEGHNGVAQTGRVFQPAHPRAHAAFEVAVEAAGSEGVLIAEGVMEARQAEAHGRAEFAH